jgi:hypothetical protein
MGAVHVQLTDNPPRNTTGPQPKTAPPPPIGSSWDAAAGPEGTLRRHLAEWIEGSACHPALAAANVQTLAGAPVLEALGGDRLEQLEGHASQYATGAVARLLRPLEPLAAAGGWWCSGLDPLRDWAPMGWGCFKPDRPRWDQERNRPRKYEHPIKVAARLFWLQSPAVVGQLVADRFGVSLPPEVAADATGAAGAFWRWWARTPALPLVVVEGAKGAAALLSIGIPAVGVPGIWNACPKGPDGRPALLPELAALPLQDRPVWVLFDRPDPDNRDPDEPKAARRLGRLLAAAGAEVQIGTCPGPDKGADDALAAGVPWEQLAAALQPLGPAPALPVLRRPDLIAPDGTYLGRAITIPADRRVVAFACAMGTGKTELIAQHLAPLQAAGLRVVLITHRRSLGEALAKRLGLPWADEAAPGSDLRQTGVALCVDSLCPASRLRINPADWAGCAVVMDEATAVMAHTLMARTAIARRRVPVLQALAQLLAGASLVLAADAQLDNATLGAIEAAAGERAYLIGSAHRPAAGRRLVTLRTRGEWFAALTPYLQHRRRIWISTTAAERDAPNSAQNIAVWVGRPWPDARVLVVDAETMADPEHDASRLAADPDGIAGRYDVVICTPAVAAGLSVTLRDHFAAVFIAAGGTTDPGAVAQAAGRVRDGCPRYLYAPQRSPGNRLQIGCGATCPDRVLLQLQHHEQAAVGQLAAAGWSATTNSAGPWLQLWAQLAAQQNRARLVFAATVVGLLEREGYAPLQGQTLPDAKPPDMLKELAQLERDAAQDRVIAAEVLTDEQARELQERRKRLSPAERAQLQRWRIDRAWGLQGAAPSHKLIEAHEQGTHRAVVLRWAVSDPAAAPLVAAHDREQARQLAPDGRAFAPDLVRDLIGPRVAGATALGLAGWLQRRGWFGADDPALLQLAAAVATYGDGITQVLGIRPGKRATTALRQLLALVGARLESERRRDGSGREAAAAYRYRVVLEPLPDGINPDQLVAAWCRNHGGTCTKKSHTDKGERFGTPAPLTALAA